MEFQHNGIRMYYETQGTGAPVLLLHGWGGSSQSWLPVQRDLAGTHRVINLDFPGFGNSAEPDANWSVDEYRDIVLALLDELRVERTDLIAHSFGGRVALMISQMQPHRIRRQVLTGCAGLIPKNDAPRGGAAHSLSRLYDNPLSRRVLGDRAVNGLRDFIRSHVGSADYKNASPRMREVFKNVIAQDLSYCLESVKAPTLLIWGENDTATPLWMGREMEKRISDAALVLFEGCSHFAYLEQYGRFIAIVKEFLED